MTTLNFADFFLIVCACILGYSICGILDSLTGIK